MLNKFPLWKNILLVIVLLLGILYSLPILYGEDPAIQITGNTGQAVITSRLQDQVKQVLTDNHIPYKSLSPFDESLLIRFKNTDDQLRAIPFVKQVIGDQYTAAMNIVSATPRWLQLIGAKPVKLGLDLRGGIHFLYDVDVNSVVARRLEGMIKNISENLRAQNIRYTNISRKHDQSIQMTFRDSANQAKAYDVLRSDYPNLLFTKTQVDKQYLLTASLSEAFLQEIRQYTIDQTLQTLRNRINELGIAEPSIQQQGAERISIDLPGVQDSARAKQILGGTATLEFHLVDTQHDASSVLASGIIPPGTRIYRTSDGTPILLKSQSVLSGDSITSATSTFDESGNPSVNISLGGGGEAFFTKTTRENIGNRMAIVYIETKVIEKEVDKQIVKTHQREERVISAPVIQAALGTQFVITGVSDPVEARNLALLLRAGSMPANVDIVEERTIGPSLGQENIQKGFLSVKIALLLIVIFMALYYVVFGIVADIALFVNLILIIAVLSILGATLTMPGIAGIVLTLGMAIDANVLINERIREELRHGMSPQASIHAGFERAFATILDANVTTLIVVAVLFGIASGPIKGFAITTMIGILTSMFTAVTFTRGMVNLIYGGKKIEKLSIGI
jgi:preprotein translocase subunit SecD